MHRTRLAALAAVTLAGPALAAGPIVSTFDLDAEGFAGGTIATTLVHMPGGGNPDGHIVIRKALGSGFDMGAQNSISPEYLGNYAAAGINSAGFDLNVFNTTLDDVMIRFRVSAAQDGWRYSFGGVLPDANAWESFDVAFDPTWDDATAILNGWAQEAGADTFANTLASVGWFEVRTVNPDDVSALVGLDNIRLVPAPSAAALLALPLLARRRR